MGWHSSSVAVALLEFLAGNEALAVVSDQHILEALGESRILPKSVYFTYKGSLTHPNISGILHFKEDVWYLTTSRKVEAFFSTVSKTQLEQ